MKGRLAPGAESRVFGGPRSWGRELQCPTPENLASVNTMSLPVYPPLSLTVIAPKLAQNMRPCTLAGGTAASQRRRSFGFQSGAGPASSRTYWQPPRSGVGGSVRP